MEERQDKCGTECGAGRDRIPWEFASLSKERDALRGEKCSLPSKVAQAALRMEAT